MAGPCYDRYESDAATTSERRFAPCLLIYTIIESARRHGHEPAAYLKEVLERLPAMNASELDALLPENWQPVDQAAAPAQMAG